MQYDFFKKVTVWLNNSKKKTNKKIKWKPASVEKVLNAVGENYSC